LIGGSRDKLIPKTLIAVDLPVKLEDDKTRCRKMRKNRHGKAFVIKTLFLQKSFTDIERIK